jgi:hypothetical protein
METMYIAWHVYPQWQDCPGSIISSVQGVIVVFDAEHTPARSLKLSRQSIKCFDKKMYHWNLATKSYLLKGAKS